MPRNQDTETILDMISEEMDWPQSARPLLAWYMNRLGTNQILSVWQEQSLRNETQPPRSKYRAFRARLSKAITPTPNPLLYYAKCCKQPRKGSKNMDNEIIDLIYQMLENLHNRITALEERNNKND